VPLTRSAARRRTPPVAVAPDLGSQVRLVARVDAVTNRLVGEVAADRPAAQPMLLEPVRRRLA
jgi:hypothetical protein